jgi:hypothetical protein
MGDLPVSGLNAILARIEAAEQAELVTGLRRIAPEIGSWAAERLLEGFTAAEVKRVLSSLRDEAGRMETIQKNQLATERGRR